jgi:transposase-like protein
MGKRRSEREKRAALRRADEIGAQAAGRELGIHHSLIYNWRRLGLTPLKRRAAPTMIDTPAGPVQVKNGNGHHGNLVAARTLLELAAEQSEPTSLVAKLIAAAVRLVGGGLMRSAGVWPPVLA